MPAILHTTAGKRLLALVLLLPSAAVALAVITSQRLGQHIEASIHRVDHTRRVQDHVDTLLRLLVEAEAAQRGYLITARNEFLEPHTAACVAIPATMAALEALLAPHGAHDPRLGAVRAAIEARLEHAERTIALTRSGNHEEAARLVSRGRGRALMDEARRALADLRAVQAQTLALSQEQLRTAAQRRTAGLTALLVANLALVTALAGLGWRYSRLNAYVKMCSWSRTIEYKGEWLTFEAYMQRRFGLRTTHGISPAEREKFSEQSRLASLTAEGASLTRETALGRASGHAVLPSRGRVVPGGASADWMVPVRDGTRKQTRRELDYDAGQPSAFVG